MSYDTIAALSCVYELRIYAADTYSEDFSELKG